MSVTSCPSCCKRCFVTIPSAIPVVRAYNSASAELKLTVCCVRDPCCEGCVSPLHNSAICAFACCWLTCPIAVCVHVHQLWECNDSIRYFALGTHFKYLTIRFTFISSLSVGQMIFRAVSFTLFMMSARSWHVYNSFRTAVLYTARL